LNRAQNELQPEHVARIHGRYLGYKDVAGVSRVVTLEEIAANEHGLNIPRYVEPKVEQETLRLDQAMLAPPRSGSSRPRRRGKVGPHLAR
jgi:type I restriction enzyme M protein